MPKIFALILFLPLFSMAQDSPLQAAPGSPPPPQGFTQQAPPNGGIHLPAKTSKRKYQLRMGSPVGSPAPVPTDNASVAPKATPSPK